MLSSKTSEREGTEQCLADTFFNQNLGEQDCVFWVDNGFLIPKPIFAGPYSRAIRRNFYWEYIHYYELGIVSLDLQFSLFSSNDFDFCIVTCRNKHANQLDGLFGGREKICNDMRNFVLTDPDFENSSTKAWGLEHLLAISGCLGLR